MYEYQIDDSHRQGLLLLAYIEYITPKDAIYVKSVGKYVKMGKKWIFMDKKPKNISFFYQKRKKSNEKWDEMGN
ncbi:hypothetical protein [Absicoccus intestinalis]|uniref:Uncharacterized protein n=1 Tax=Absicoccus intestinalis TaxID=2926319 RepID=A0ABU4WNH9_9FIRM|nr:hypothetical protein [Absicoccus sp. CLA-KB-P134]MDX8417298.1 hypothetical protein [Absicoccus sp. CLA-KB-P134]